MVTAEELAARREEIAPRGSGGAARAPHRASGAAVGPPPARAGIEGLLSTDGGACPGTAPLWCSTRGTRPSTAARGAAKTLTGAARPSLGSLPTFVARRARCALADRWRRWTAMTRRAHGPPRFLRAYADLLAVPQPGQRAGAQSVVLLHVPRIHLDRQHLAAAALLRARQARGCHGADVSRGPTRQRT